MYSTCACLTMTTLVCSGKSDDLKNLTFIARDLIYLLLRRATEAEISEMIILKHEQIKQYEPAKNNIWGTRDFFFVFPCGIHTENSHKQTTAPTSKLLKCTCTSQLLLVLFNVQEAIFTSSHVDLTCRPFSNYLFYCLQLCLSYCDVL